MSSRYPPVAYGDYLQLSQLLNCQKPKSVEYKKPAHDEMLFITVHQVYELWFKQILTEIESILSLFKAPEIPENQMGLISARLGRVIQIQKVLLAQLDVLETLTPLDFLEFRDFLFPASGFQSLQFRLIENKLGLRPEDRLKFNQSRYDQFVPNDQRPQLLASETEPSLYLLIERWLERTPVLQMADFDFWQSYQQSVFKMLADDESVIKSNPHLQPETQRRNLDEINKTKETFQSLFDKTRYEDLRSQGKWRLSYRAVHAAMLIQLYRDRPLFQIPFQILSSLMDIDELFTAWRYRHALMAMRMLGTKIGTGGSTGHEYLKQATDKHRIFADYFQLATFYIPRSLLPPLPLELERKMSFQF